MGDPRVLSIDLETYGLCETGWDGKPLPPQTCFNPRSSLEIDGVSLDSLILTCSITLPTSEPGRKTSAKSAEPTSASGSSSSIWDCATIAAMQPGPTMVFNMSRRDHRLMVAQWLDGAHTILGMNLPFDIQYLRAVPCCWEVLDGKRHTLIDLSVVNYLHSELRPERSLKNIGQIIGTHGNYEEHETRRDRAYPYPTEQVLKYNARDTHRTMLDIARLAAMIQEDFPGTDKLSPFSVQFYSDALWLCIRMSEAGIPVDEIALRLLEMRLFRTQEAVASYLSRNGLLIRGEGSATSKKEFIDKLCNLIDHPSSTPPSPTSPSDSPPPTATSTKPKAIETVPPSTSRPAKSSLQGSRSSTAATTASSGSSSLASSSSPPAPFGEESRSPGTTMSTSASSDPSGDSSTTKASSSSSPRSTPTSSSTSVSHLKPGQSIRQHPLLELTESKGEISFMAGNRNLLMGHLPEEHPYRELLERVSQFTEAQKIAGTYLSPLLRHQKNKPTKRAARLVRTDQEIAQFDIYNPACRPATHPHRLPPTHASESGSENSSRPASTPKTSALTGSPSPGTKGTGGPASLESHLTRSTARLSARSLGSDPKVLKRLLRRLTRSLKAASTRELTLSDLRSEYLAATSGTTTSPPTRIRLAVPNWLVVPTHPKDGQGDEGGTKQGRIIAKSAAQPQTWPPPVKKCIRSRWPGGTILICDISQAEPRAVAVESGDPVLLEIFQKGKDLHTTTTIKLFGDDVAERHPYKPGPPESGWKSGNIKNDPRQWGKTSFLLLLYRGGWEKMQSTVLNDSGVLLPDELCFRVAKDVPKIYSGLYAWQDRIIKQAKRTGRIELPLTGQSRWFMGGSDWDENEIVNIIPQAIAGNTVLRIQARLHTTMPGLNARDPGLYMFNNIYDSVWFDCRTPQDVVDARALFAEAVEYVATKDYWAWLQERSGHRVPLAYDVKELPS